MDKVTAEVARVAAGGLAATDEAFAAAAVSLRTTDSTTKMASARVSLPAASGTGSVSVTVTGIAKGVGMIHPKMATMLSIVLTDATASPATLRDLLRASVGHHVEPGPLGRRGRGANDSVFLLASGAAGAASADDDPAARSALAAALEAVARDLARQQARDGEGATALITCQVSGAADDTDARAVARAVISLAGQGRGPRQGRELGPHRRSGGQAVVPEAYLLEAAGLSPTDAAARAGQPAEVEPATLRIAIAGHLAYDGALGGRRASTRPPPGWP